MQGNQKPLGVLHIKLNRTAKALRAWSKTVISQAKVVVAICREVIAQLEVAQESRNLSQKEIDLLAVLKQRVLVRPSFNAQDQCFAHTTVNE